MLTFSVTARDEMPSHSSGATARTTFPHASHGHTMLTALRGQLRAHWGMHLSCMDFINGHILMDLINPLNYRLQSMDLLSIDLSSPLNYGLQSMDLLSLLNYGIQSMDLLSPLNHGLVKYGHIKSIKLWTCK